MLSFRLALIGRLSCSKRRLLETLGNTPALVMEGREKKLCLGMTLRRGAGKRLRSPFEIFLYALALKRHDAENEKRFSVSLLCKRPEFFDYGAVIAALVGRQALFESRCRGGRNEGHNQNGGTERSQIAEPIHGQFFWCLLHFMANLSLPGGMRFLYIDAYKGDGCVSKVVEI